jgi:membrane protease YdiL (CAAX protease family)
MIESTEPIEATEATETPRWSVARIVAYSLLVVIAFLAVQTAVVFFVIVSRFGDDHAAVQQWVESAESDGALISLATIASALLCVPLVKLLAARREPNAWNFLGVRPTGLGSILFWCVLLTVLVLAIDLLAASFGGNVVPEFMVQTYQTSGSAVLFFAALVLAAPLLEEDLNRGFMLGGQEASGVSPIKDAVDSSLAWAAIHVQYDN